jgi:hypothetical protein
MQRYYAPTPDAPGTEGYIIDPEIGWVRRGTPVRDVIAEIANVSDSLASAIVDHLGDRYAWDAFDGGYENPYSSETYGTLCECAKTRARNCRFEWERVSLAECWRCPQKRRQFRRMHC